MLIFLSDITSTYILKIRIMLRLLYAVHLFYIFLACGDP